jgi:kanamycin kinase/aminoglycoside 3'-phosphotransferase-2
LSKTHGNWCLPNVVLDPETARVTGLLDTGRVGRADRYPDLALMSRSLRSGELNPQYGNELADHYLTRCGHDAADEDKLGFYALVDEFF